MELDKNLIEEACRTDGLVPRMRRLRNVIGLLTYYLVCDQPAPLFLSYCFALLRRFSLLSWPFLTWLFCLKTAASSPVLPLARFGDDLFWGCFGVFLC